MCRVIKQRHGTCGHLGPLMLAPGYPGCLYVRRNPDMPFQNCPNIKKGTAVPISEITGRCSQCKDASPYGSEIKARGQALQAGSQSQSYQPGPVSQINPYQANSNLPARQLQIDPTMPVYPEERAASTLMKIHHESRSPVPEPALTSIPIKPISAVTAARIQEKYPGTPVTHESEAAFILMEMAHSGDPTQPRPASV
ncbi:hypothetical protein ACEPPN_007742 [Leptodophora sp. 'Broadleaf-Isolate-01']